MLRKYLLPNLILLRADGRLQLDVLSAQSPYHIFSSPYLTTQC